MFPPTYYRLTEVALTRLEAYTTIGNSALVGSIGAAPFHHGQILIAPFVPTWRTSVTFSRHNDL